MKTKNKNVYNYKKFIRGDLLSIEKMRYPIRVFSVDPGYVKMGVRYEIFYSNTSSKTISHEVENIGKDEYRWIEEIEKFIKRNLGEDKIEDVDICIIEEQMYTNPKMKTIERIIQTFFWCNNPSCCILSVNSKIKYRHKYFESIDTKKYKEASMALCLKILENYEEDKEILKRLSDVKTTKLRSDFADPVLQTYSTLNDFCLIEKFHEIEI